MSMRNFHYNHLKWLIQPLHLQGSIDFLVEVGEHLDLSPMGGMGNIAIVNHMCSSMGYPRTEFPLKAYLGSKMDLLPFDANHRLVSSFVILG